MTKVGDKAGIELAKNLEFRKALNSAVWDETLTIEEFESKRQKVMEDYNLVNHRWFAQLYEACASWIPAYFNDIFMTGLLKTTSCSEAENSYFGSFTNNYCTLVEFFMQFNSAIEEQRYKQAKLSAECEGSFPETKTPLPIKHQATTLYTTNMFYEFQTELWEGSFNHHITARSNTRDEWTYTVLEKGGKPFEVTRHKDVEKTDCMCMKFTRLSIFCRHVLLVFKTEEMEEIPGQYIVTRWTRDTCTRPVHDIWWAKHNNIQAENEARSVANQLWNEFYTCMGLVNG
ncbi:protein FAR1-RELATED SEQUENCE 3-like [Ipomoea triloba]|uniref:protein FAR1-RELATED SEQUENCE 3-like n=1 Tax=Ipomoea triloba TaxID=35885 RepID=UPI00125DEEC9|nr:protein FAR1-RELATED SEQUENCE 3-like [Ipomoea triloba]